MHALLVSGSDQTCRVGCVKKLASEPRPSPLRIYRRVINCAWVNTLKAGKAWANTSREGRRWVDAGSRAG